MTVVTSVPWDSLPLRSIRVAHRTITASPSTTWPFSSQITTRSPSPSSAMPRCEPVSMTFWHIAAG